MKEFTSISRRKMSLRISAYCLLVPLYVFYLEIFWMSYFENIYKCIDISICVPHDLATSIGTGLVHINAGHTSTKHHFLDMCALWLTSDQSRVYPACHPKSALTGSRSFYDPNENKHDRKGKISMCLLTPQGKLVHANRCVNEYTVVPQSGLHCKANDSGENFTAPLTYLKCQKHKLSRHTQSSCQQCNFGASEWFTVDLRASQTPFHRWVFLVHCNCNWFWSLSGQFSRCAVPCLEYSVVQDGQKHSTLAFCRVVKSNKTWLLYGNWFPSELLERSVFL